MKKNKYTYLHVLQGSYGFGWEDLTASESYREAYLDKKAYMENEGGNYRIIKRRELNQQEQESDEFYKAAKAAINRLERADKNRKRLFADLDYTDNEYDEPVCAYFVLVERG